MDTIVVYDSNGNKSLKEIIMCLSLEDKNYILYRNANGKDKNVYASYYYGELTNENVELFNDLTEEEYALLESAYEEGKNNYDK